MKKILIPLIVISFLVGCGSIKSVCPQYPKPTQEVLNKIKSLKDNKVDEWIIEQYKLNQKLKACNGL